MTKQLKKVDDLIRKYKNEQALLEESLRKKTFELKRLESAFKEAIPGKEEVVSEVQKKHMTFDGKTTGFDYNNPVIPDEFVAVNTKRAKWTKLSKYWNKGLVIQDLKGNQFVWVPVDEKNIKYEKDFAYPSYDYLTDYNTLNDNVFNGVDEYEQIILYGGFYISRFEAGNQLGNIVSKRNFEVWNNVNYLEAKNISQSMYKREKVKSGLLTGTMWDVVMKWLESEGNLLRDCRIWGNYYDSILPVDQTDNVSLKTTGYSEFWQVKNIYDLAGNVWEFTNEKTYRNNPILRGGAYNSNGCKYSAAYRKTINILERNTNFGFRVALYIL